LKEFHKVFETILGHCNPKRFLIVIHLQVIKCLGNKEKYNETLKFISELVDLLTAVNNSDLRDSIVQEDLLCYLEGTFFLET
jgi:hypothetical protein